MINCYDKMNDYVGSVFNVFQLINRKAEQQQDRRMKMIALVVFNYVKFMAKEHNVNLKNIVEPDSINLIPVFEYIAANNIELYDFATINVNELDVNNKEDLERFVLTHVYYITQSR